MKSLRKISSEMKEREEQNRLFISNKENIIVLRSDGRAFSKLTKKLQKPFDLNFIESMDAAAREISKCLGQVSLNYVQSDEVSTIIMRDQSGNVPFGGRLEKLMTLASSSATLGFNERMRKRLSNLPGGCFDSRAILFKDLGEVEEYLLWRRMDASKNSISMAAESHYSSRELMGVSTSERLELLKGTRHETIDDGVFWGRYVTSQDSLPATKSSTEAFLKSLKEKSEGFVI